MNMATNLKKIQKYVINGYVYVEKILIIKLKIIYAI